MRSIIVGLRVTQPTTVSVQLPASVQVGASLKIMRDNSGKWASPPGWTVPLTPGDYVVTVDTSEGATAVAPFRISASTPVTFMSAAPSTTVRTLTSWSGTELMVRDPKDPWPPPPPPPPDAAVAAATIKLAATSSVAPAMLSLVDTFAGKGAETKPAIHALLIGIDAYAPGPGKDGAIYPKLTGTVRDLLEVEKFLRNDVGVPAEQITLLLAPNADSPGSDRGTPLPTYENIVKAWLALIEKAQPGDIVYVHYSGHGGRATSIYPAKQTRYDESIAPCDINTRATGRYLRDVEIATLLRRMNKDGLLATLVLDSCYSGSATRGDQAQVRRGDHDDDGPRPADAQPSLVATAAELEEVARELGQNPYGIDEPWRVPGGTVPYTVVAACQANESAYEYAFDGKNRRGALTYFWLEALRGRGAATTYRSAFRTVFAGVTAIFRDQSPVLLGASDRLVLGAGILPQQSTIAVNKVNGNTVELGAGQANLMAVGTRLAILPGDMLPELVDLSTMPLVEVIDVDSASSTARFVGTPIALAPGSQAVITTYAPRLQRSVHLLATPETAPLAALIASDTSKLIAIAKDAGDFQIDVADGCFTILDPAGSPRNIRPAVPVADPDAATKLLARLVHLAKFQNVLELRNSDANAPLANRLSIELLTLPAGWTKGDPLDKAAPAGDRPAFKSESWLAVRISNLSSRFLNVALFDLNPGLGIKSLIENGFNAGEVRTLALRTFLPEGFKRGWDTLKVFGTLQPSQFGLLELPDLDKPVRAAKGLSAARGPLDQLFDSVQSPQIATRHAEIGTSPTMGWTSAEVSLEVVKD